MSGLTLRRLVLENIIAVAMHSPFPRVRRTGVQMKYLTESARRVSIWTIDQNLLSLYTSKLRRWGTWWPSLVSSCTESSTTPSTSSPFSLMTLEEIEYQRQAEQSNASSSSFTPPVVLFTRPSLSLLRGMGGAAANCLLGSLLSPIIFISLLLEKISTSHSVMDVFRGVLFSSFWATLFGMTALYAGAQQAVLSTWNGCVGRPWNYLWKPIVTTLITPQCEYCLGDNTVGKSEVNASHARKVTPNSTGTVSSSTSIWRHLSCSPSLWSVISCRFEPPTPVGNTHSVLTQYINDNLIWECGRDRRGRSERMVRSSQQRSSRSSSFSSSSSSSTGSLGGVHAGERDLSGEGSPSYYSLLGISDQATASEIKTAYKRLALKVHPDRNPNSDAAEQFLRLRTAYQVLSSPESRKAYDAGGEGHQEKINAGKKNRNALRALFGGDYCVRLVGDTFLNSFVCRVIDHIDFTEEELSVLKARTLERSAEEILTRYLGKSENTIPFASLSSKDEGTHCHADNSCSAGCPPHHQCTVGSVAGIFFNDLSAASVKEWEMKIERMWRSSDGPLNVGLGAEVLYWIGKEYEKVVLYATDITSATAARRPISSSSSTLPPTSWYSFSLCVPKFLSDALGIAVAIPRRLALSFPAFSDYVRNCLNRYNALLQLAKRRKDATQRQQLSVDAAWYWGTHMLKGVARESALAVLYDPSIALDKKEQRRRAQGLQALSQLMKRLGKPYSPATHASVDRLQTSLFTLYSKKNV